MSKSTTLYPIRGRWLHEHPTAVHTVETKAEADELIASGAYTDDPSHPDRDTEAADLRPGAAPVEEPPEAPPVE